MYSWRVKFLAGLASISFVGALLEGLFALVQASPTGGRDPFLGMLFVAVGCVVGFVSMHFASMERRVEQEFRDRSAQRLAEKAELRAARMFLDGSDSPFVLYLRPFALEKAVRRWRGGLPTSESFFLEGGWKSFDSYIQEIVANDNLSLVKIGCRSSDEGAGSVVTSDATWREVFRQLAGRATTIVVVPGMEAGIRAEIRWLRVGLNPPSADRSRDRPFRGGAQRLKNT
jgi:hypothetical protein